MSDRVARSALARQDHQHHDLLLFDGFEIAMTSLGKAHPVIALDLEGTLISNAVSQIARPGLFTFLEGCKAITPRVVIYTMVSEERFREIAERLVNERSVPEWFSTMEYICWTGETKDLRLIPDSDLETAILLDDYVGYRHPSQEAHWIEVRQFGHPYPDTDAELEMALRAIRARLSD